MRVELYMAMLAGFAGGLAGTLWSGLVSTPLLARWPTLRLQPGPPETAARLLAGAAIHGTCGATAGLLFWLGWGLVAVVAAPWPAVGAAFGGLVWTAGTLPALGALVVRGQLGRGALLVTAVESLVACVAAGLLCAYVWHESP